ncbi:MAG: ATPase, T2SS/T4P/T4SS family [Pseudomonadota bacterium]
MMAQTRGWYVATVDFQGTLRAGGRAVRVTHMFTVVLTEKGGSSRTMEFDKPEVTIGRVQGNDIILPKGNISKRHSRIVLKDAKFIIVDLKSTNGTYVNGRKITSPHILKDNDKVYIGDFTLTIEPAGGRADAPPPPPPPPPPPRTAKPPPPTPRKKAEPEDDDLGEYLAPEADFSSDSVDFVDEFDAEPGLDDGDKLDEFDPEFEDPAPPPPPPPPPSAQPRVAVKKAPRARPAPPPRGGVRGAPVARPAHAASPAARAQAAVFEVLVQNPTWEDVAASPQSAQEAVRRAISEAQASFPAGASPDAVSAAVLAELTGLGPLDDLLADASVSQIFANAPHCLFVERNGEIEATDAVFSSDDSMSFVIRKLLATARSQVGEGLLHDVRLTDGTHLCAMLPPVGAAGPVLTLRKVSQHTVTLDKLVDNSVLSARMAEFLQTCVEQRKNILISSNNSADGLALLRAIANMLPQDERLICIEEVAQLNLPQPNVVSLEAAPAVGIGGVTLRDLARSAIRLAPDRLIVGDCRGAEALDLLQIFGGAVDGSVLLVHGHGVRDAMTRIEAMASLGSSDVSPRSLRELMASAIEVVVQITRYASGVPRVSQISVISGMEIDLVTTQDIFSFRNEGSDRDGNQKGRFQASGVVPRFFEELQRQGEPVNMGLFRDEG